MNSLARRSFCRKHVLVDLADDEAVILPPELADELTARVQNVDIARLLWGKV